MVSGYLHNGVFDMYKKRYPTGERQRMNINYNVDQLEIYLDLQNILVGDDILVTLNDYTALHRAQLQLEKYEEELKRSNQHLEEFSYAALHGFKEPTRKVVFCANRLKQVLLEQMTEEQTRLFTRMQLAGERIGLLIDDLLMYSHVSRGTFITERVDLNK